jgi:YjbE family integral membrane protein
VGEEDAVDWRFVLAIAGIAILDIVLSGDNALVIAAAASRLPRAQRIVAIVWGGVGAIVFRILLTIAATEVLQIPLLQAVGGVILMFIAIRILPQGDDGSNQTRTASDHLFVAVLTILVADATMSIDNILAVGALAHGNILLLTIGLTFSMAVLFIASALITRLMEVMAWLIDVAAVIIALTAANLFVSDPLAERFFHFDQAAMLGIHVGCVAFILLVDLFFRRRSHARGGEAKHATDAGSSGSAMLAGDSGDQRRQPAEGTSTSQNGHDRTATSTKSIMLDGAVESAQASQAPTRTEGAGAAEKQ